MVERKKKFKILNSLSYSTLIFRFTQFMVKYIYQIWYKCIYFLQCSCPREASLGIMGAQLRASQEPPIHHNTIVLRGLKGALNPAPLYRETPVRFICLAYSGSTNTSCLIFNTDFNDFLTATFENFCCWFR